MVFYISNIHEFWLKIKLFKFLLFSLVHLYFDEIPNDQIGSYMHAQNKLLTQFGTVWYGHSLKIVLLFICTWMLNLTSLFPMIHCTFTHDENFIKMISPTFIKGDWLWDYIYSLLKFSDKSVSSVQYIIYDCIIQYNKFGDVKWIE